MWLGEHPTFVRPCRARYLEHHQPGERADTPVVSLTQPHLIGQDTALAQAVARHQPLVALLLVRTQVPVEIGRQPAQLLR